MTRTASVEVICAACGANAGQTVLVSTGQFGAPDLDFRPASPARSTITFVIQECSNCGLCAPRLEDPPDGASRIVHDSTYRSILAEQSDPVLVRRFRAWAFVAKATGDDVAAAWAHVNAAWASDDADRNDLAKVERIAAADLIDGMRARGVSIFSERGGTEALLSDLWRRAGLWEQAHNEALLGLERTEDSTIGAVCTFQVQLAERYDDGRHVVDDARKRKPRLP